MRYQRYQRSKSPVRMFLCKPDNRKWLIVTGGLLAVIITLSVILAVTLSGRASGASGVRDPANLRQAVDSIDGIPLFTAYIPEDSPGRPGVLRTVESITYSRNRQHQRGSRRGGPQRLSEHHLRRGILALHGGRSPNLPASARQRGGLAFRRPGGKPFKYRHRALRQC